MQLIDWIIICAFFLLWLLISLYYRKRANENLDSFFLGGRKFPWYLAGLSMVATTFAADTPLAVTEMVVKNGISGNWLWWSFLSGGMLTTFLFAHLWRRSGVMTEAEFVELRYSGPAAAFLRGFKSVYLGLFINCLIIGWVNLAMNSILSVFFGIPEEEVMIYTGSAMLLTMFYTSLSGLWGVVVTDAIQFVVAMAGTIILAIIVVSSDRVGGLSALQANLPEGTLDFFPTIGEASSDNLLSISIPAFIGFLAVQWWASWYPGAEPGGGGYVAQRMMSAKNESHAIAATLFFQVAHYCIRPWPWILVGLASIVLYPELSADNPKLGYIYAMKEFLPAGLKGLLLAAFFAAYMSTIATQLNWGASYLVNDLYRRFLAPGKGEKHLLWVSKGVTVLLAIIGLGLTTQMNSIQEVWSFLIECGAGLGLVLILRWYWWRINAWSEIAATITPLVVFALLRIVTEGTGEYNYLFTVGITTIAWIIVTYLTKPENKEKLSQFAKLVQPGGWWGEFTNQDENKTIPYRFICWLSAIAMTYSILFAIGKWLFGDITWGSIYTIVAIVSGIVLYYAYNTSSAEIKSVNDYISQKR